MKHKELKELKKLLEKEKVSEKALKKILEILKFLSKSNKSDFEEAHKFCSKLIKKKTLDKKVSKKIEEKLEKLSKSHKKEKKDTKEETPKSIIIQPTRVTKTNMVQAISEKTSLSKQDANCALNSILETITQSLTKGDNVTLIGFGTFSTELRAKRDGFNPATGQRINIPEHTIAKFRAGTKLKEAVK